jgi:hypothetical protein
MKITPEIELPDLYEPFPEDLAALCHSNLRGMKQMTVHRMVQRGQYKIVASAQLQEKPTRNSVPTVPAEEICEVAMQIIASDIAETDDPGNYKVSFIGVGGRGRKIVSKHIRMREEQSPRAVNTMDEGDLLETQMSYIGELHQVNMGLMEVVSGMIRPLLEENKEMMKICTESVKKVGEVEAARMSHELEIRRMEDENRLELFKEQQSQDKWNELFNHVKSTGAMESVIEGLMKKFAGPQKSPEPKNNPGAKSPVPARKPAAVRKPLPTPEEISNLPAVRKPSEISIARPADTDIEKEKNITPEDKSQEIAEEEKIQLEDIQKEVQEEMEKSPLVALAQALKFSIDENGQWKKIYKTLNDDQIEIFDEIISAESDDEVKAAMDKMKKTSVAKLMMLRAMMDEDQVKILGAMLDA